MKLSTACVVFAAFAAAAAPARADSAVSVLSDAFFRLIETQKSIQLIEKRNDDFLSPALNKITRELHQGLNPDIFQTGMTIFNTLVGVNLKIGHIAGNATSMLMEIDSVALTVTTVHFSHPGLNYDIKKISIQKLCEDTLAKTNLTMQLIDDTKEMIAKGVIRPLKVLQSMIESTANEEKVRKEADIKLQQQIIDNPFSNIWKPFTGHDAKEAAKALQQEDENTIERIKKLVTSILDHANWLEDHCKTIRDDLDYERTTIAAIHGGVSGSSLSVNTTAGGLDILIGKSPQKRDFYLQEGSKALVQMMTNLRAQVAGIIRMRTTRAVDSYDPYQTATDVGPLAVYREHPTPLNNNNKPSWLDKTPVNGCIYIYNNRTAGCIFVKTFDYMKEQYTSLSKKVLDFEASFKAYEKAWDNLKPQVIRASKNSLNNREASEFVGDLETKKLMWSDDITKLRDLSVTLNFYAESLFSEATVPGSNDVTLNEGIMRDVDGNKKIAMEIINKNVNDILILNNLVADILSQLSINDRCSDESTQLPPGSYPDFAAPIPTVQPLQTAAEINLSFPVVKDTNWFTKLRQRWNV